MSYPDAISATITDTIELTEHIALITSNGLKYLYIDHPKAKASISLFGAHLLSFTPTGADPVIWISDCAVFNGVKAIRGGVPICWPWFGNAKLNSSIVPQAQHQDFPAHGFARNSHWQLLDSHSDAGSCHVRMQLCSSAESKRLWPHDFTLTTEFIISDSLSINLNTENTGNKDFCYGGALHSYLQQSQPDAVTVSGLDSQQPNAHIVLDGAVDRICPSPSPQIIMADREWQRQLLISSVGHSDMVVWNPWQAGAQAFTDMSDDAYQTMFCLEPAITGSNAVTLQPGSRHTLATTICVQAMSD